MNILASEDASNVGYLWRGVLGVSLRYRTIVFCFLIILEFLFIIVLVPTGITLEFLFIIVPVPTGLILEILFIIVPVITGISLGFLMVRSRGNVPGAIEYSRSRSRRR